MTAHLPPLLAVGQHYACESRHAERRLEATVGRVDKVASHVTVVSIALTDKGAHAIIPEAAHMPFDETAFRSSCRTLLQSATPLPADFEEGYKIWRAAFDSGKGGFYTLSVDQALDVMIDTLNHGERQP